MRKLLVTAVTLALFACPTFAAEHDGESAATSKKIKADVTDIDAVTSASLVQKDYLQQYTPKGFTQSKVKKALFVLADPRVRSVNMDLAYTAMAHLESNGVEVEVRDLYAMQWQPVLYLDEFYSQKDGIGETKDDVAHEQALIEQADYVIFSYTNWHDTPNAMVKGYQERVFSKQFAYDSGPKGPIGLLKDKGMYTIMNCGFLGGGRGYIGDGVGINDAKWDEYMQAFKVLDDDTASWWGMDNLGRFMNDRYPKNDSENYQKEITQLRQDLTQHLDKVFL